MAFNLPFGLNLSTNEPTDRRQVVSTWANIDTELPHDLRWEGMVVWDGSGKKHKFLKSRGANVAAAVWQDIGTGGGGAAPVINALGDINDVTITGVATNHVIMWNNTASEWQNKQMPASAISYSSSGGTVITSNTDVQDAIKKLDTTLGGLTGGTRYLGPYDASGGNLPGGTSHSNGDFYIIEKGGTLTIRGKQENVIEGDMLLWNNTGTPGWDLIKAQSITTLASLTDTDFRTAPTGGESLVYDRTSQKWKPGFGGWLENKLQAGDVIVHGYNHKLQIGGDMANGDIPEMKLMSDKVLIDGKGTNAGDGVQIFNRFAGPVVIRSENQADTQHAHVKVASQKVTLDTTGTVEFNFKSGNYIFPTSTPATGQVLKAGTGGQLRWGTVTASGPSTWLKPELEGGSVTISPTTPTELDLGTKGNPLGIIDIHANTRMHIEAADYRVTANTFSIYKGTDKILTFPTGKPSAGGMMLKADSNGTLTWDSIRSEDHSIPTNLPKGDISFNGGNNSLTMGAGSSKIKTFTVVSTDTLIKATNILSLDSRDRIHILNNGTTEYTLPITKPKVGEGLAVSKTGTAGTLEWVAYAEELNDLSDVDYHSGTTTQRPFLKWTGASGFDNVELFTDDMKLKSAITNVGGANTVLQSALNNVQQNVDRLTQGVRYLGAVPAAFNFATATNGSKFTIGGTTFDLKDGDFVYFETAGTATINDSTGNPATVTEGDQALYHASGGWHYIAHGQRLTSINGEPARGAVNLGLAHLKDVKGDKDTALPVSDGQVLTYKSASKKWEADTISVEADDVVYKKEAGSIWKKIDNTTATIGNVEDALHYLKNLQWEVIKHAAEDPTVTKKVSLSVTFTGSSIKSGTYEVGEPVNGTLKPTFNQGEITDGDGSTTHPLVGGIKTTTYQRNGATISSGAVAVDHAAEGDYQYGVKINYNGGTGVYNSALGSLKFPSTVLDNQRATGNITTNATPIIKVRYKAYAASAAALSNLPHVKGSQITSLGSGGYWLNTKGGKGTFSFRISKGQRGIVFAIPDKSNTVTVVLVESSNADVTSTFNVTTVPVSLNGAPNENYKVYADELPTGGYSKNVTYKVTIS